MRKENKELLVEGAKIYGVHLSNKEVESFEHYLQELLKWNKKINLTAIHSEKDIILKHFIDSFTLYPEISSHAAVLDVGSGAGFPGIPLKIIQPHLEMTLIDSVRKKVDFQSHMIRTLGLKGIQAVHGRVQDQELFQPEAESFDVTVSRAFSNLHVFLELSFPLLKKDGLSIAMKGTTGREEICCLTEAEKLRFHLHKTISLTLPFSSYKRMILLFKKI